MSPGHVGLEGDEKIDKLAMEAASTPGLFGFKPLPGRFSLKEK